MTDGDQEMRLVLIEWQDSHSLPGWQQLHGGVEDRALVCRSVGWLVMEGVEATVVVPHLNQAEAGVPLQGSGIITIPTRAVLRVVPLHEDHQQGMAPVSTSSEVAPLVRACGQVPA